jgi:hypothetical protein
MAPSDIFDFFTGEFTGHVQAEFFTVGLISFIAGVFLIGYVAYIDVHYRRYKGKITGLRKDKDVYWPVVAYSDAEGQRHEAITNSGSSLIGKNVPGFEVEVLINPANPDDITVATDRRFLSILAGIAIVFGVGCLLLVMKDISFSWAGLLVLAGFIVSAVMKFAKMARPVMDAYTSGEWEKKKAEFLAAKLQKQKDWPLATDAEIVSVRATQAAQFAQVPQVLSALGFIMCAGGGALVHYKGNFPLIVPIAGGVLFMIGLYGLVSRRGVR